METSNYFINKTYVLEGMDFVRKEDFIEKYFPEYKVWNPDNQLLSDYFGNSKDLWVTYYGVLDFLKIDTFNNIIINNGLISSYVNERLYNNRYLDDKVTEYYKKNVFVQNGIGHIYLCHHDSKTAKELYIDNPKFKSFDHYWIYYTIADQLYREAYNKLSIIPRVFEVLSENQWNEIIF